MHLEDFDFGNFGLALCRLAVYHRKPVLKDTKWMCTPRTPIESLVESLLKTSENINAFIQHRDPYYACSLVYISTVGYS